MNKLCSLSQKKISKVLFECNYISVLGISTKMCNADVLNKDGQGNL